MELTRSHTYDATVEEVIGMLADADAVIRRYSGMGHRDIEIRECERTDEWHRDGDGWTGTFHVDVAGAPVEMSGTLSLTPDGDRSRYEVTTTMKVKVPLVGGKIADWAGKNDVPRTLQAEFDANDEWLAARS